jgi:RimJ/RimL family protein N-acetyltransferase
VYDEEYFFLYPEPVADECDVASAIDALRLYAIREEIALVITEVPSDEASTVRDLFANSEVIEEDEFCTVRAQSEIMLSNELPSARGVRLLLSPLCPADEKKYAELCRDESTNEYWGYNYSDDVSEPEDSYFIENALGEYSRGVAASFAVRFTDEFIGEALLYAFDLLGGAECAVRLLPKYRGLRLSEECVSLLCNIAKSIGLKRVYATVDNRNRASIHLFEKTFEFVESKDGITRFLLKM